MKVGLYTQSGQLSALVFSVLKGEKDLFVAWNARSASDAALQQQRTPVELFLIATDVPLSVAQKTVRDVQAISKCQVLVLTRDADRDTRYIFEMMSQGASDHAVLPNEPSASYLFDFMRKIQLQVTLANSAKMMQDKKPYDKPTLVVIGASTGGPGIITHIMERLHAPLPAAVIIVLHVAKSFTEGMTYWMQKYTQIPVQIVKEGDTPRENNIYLAATDEHLILTPKETFRYSEAPMQTYYHPSVDIFFHSILERRPPGMAVLLTGMGEDGAYGLLDLRKAGWHTVAQDKETCVVYGMPKVAMEIGAATHVMNPDNIANEINVFAGIREHRRNHGYT